MKLERNFNLSEFKCKCGECEIKVNVLKNIKKLAKTLQVLRDFVGYPIRINSAYRCKAHNEAIGGVEKSQHLLGKAVDITIDTYNPDKVYKVVKNLQNNPYVMGGEFNGVGRYNTFTHVDIRSRKDRVEWDNRD